MNALTTIPADAVALHLPDDAPIADWWMKGRILFDRRRSADWDLADWMADGAERYGQQACFDFATAQFGIEQRVARKTIEVAKAFPPAQRASDLPFSIHAYIAQLPSPEQRLATLQRASAEHWGEKRAKAAVTEHRQQAAMFEENDPERLATIIYRAWNNATPDVREHAWTYLKHAAANGFALIDEEVVIDG
jgi:hypothetical protein